MQKRKKLSKKIKISKKYILKMIYDEVIEDIFDMSNVRFFNKEIEKKKWGMLILYYAFGQLSSVKRLV